MQRRPRRVVCRRQLRRGPARVPHGGRHSPNDRQAVPLVGAAGADDDSFAAEVPGLEARVAELDTQLTDLKIESLDLAMIVFDIEDGFGIEIPYNANEEVEAFKTVGSVVDRVKSLIAAKQASAAKA